MTESEIAYRLRARRQKRKPLPPEQPILEELTADQKDMILHASGLSNSKTSYRRSYCTEDDDARWLGIVKHGLATGPHTSKILTEGYAYFYLTAEGIAYAKQLKQEVDKS